MKSHICESCKKEFVDYVSAKRRFCSQKCSSSFQVKEKHSCWKGKRKDPDGYVLIWKPNHPLSNSSGYIREHRIVMEQHLNRYLTATEVIHHINRVKNDNRIKNLRLYSNNSIHVQNHFFKDGSSKNITPYKCENCEKIFFGKKAMKKYYVSKFCSRDCYMAFCKHNTKLRQQGI